MLVTSIFPQCFQPQTVATVLSSGNAFKLNWSKNLSFIMLYKILHTKAFAKNSHPHKLYHYIDNCYVWKREKHCGKRRKCYSAAFPLFSRNVSTMVLFIWVIFTTDWETKGQFSTTGVFSFSLWCILEQSKSHLGEKVQALKDIPETCDFVDTNYHRLEINYHCSLNILTLQNIKLHCSSLTDAFSGGLLGTMIMQFYD